VDRRAPFADRLLRALGSPGGVAFSELAAIASRSGASPDDVQAWLDRLHHNGWLYRLPLPPGEEWAPDRFRLTAHARDHLEHDHRRAHVGARIAQVA
jgi:hypothetical protein